jgi:hypothetical protein
MKWFILTLTGKYKLPRSKRSIPLKTLPATTFSPMPLQVLTALIVLVRGVLEKPTLLTSLSVDQ